MCLLLLVAAFAPRVAFVLIWIFGNRVDAAFDTWLWPFLGLLFAPWTAIAYVLLWSPAGGVNGAEWVLVGIAVAVDLASWGSRLAKRRPAYA